MQFNRYIVDSATYLAYTCSSMNLLDVLKDKVYFFN